MTLAQAKAYIKANEHLSARQMSAAQDRLMIRAIQVVRTNRKPLAVSASKNHGNFSVHRRLNDGGSNWEFWATATTLSKAIKIALALSSRYSKAIYDKDETILWTDGRYSKTAMERYGKKRPTAALKNPRGGAVLIYSDALKIYAKKGQKHRCDAGCVRNGHRYYHPFTAGAAIYGLPNGDILIRSTKGKKLWGMF